MTALVAIKHSLASNIQEKHSYSVDNHSSKKFKIENFLKFTI